MQHLRLAASSVRARSWIALPLTLLVLSLAAPAANAQEGATAPDDAAAPAKPAAKKAAPAQPSSADTAEPVQENMLVWVYNAEGVFFFPQLIISLIVIGMIALYSMQIRTGSFVPVPFLQQFDVLFKDKKFQEAYELTRKDESFLGKMVSAGIGRLPVGVSQAMEAAQEAADDESMKHEHRLSYLAMIANLATLVGLLGTVWGMVGSFMVISRSDTAPKPSELATGVSQALCTTVAGLLQAIPATLAFTILKNRAARLGFEAGMACEQIMTRFASVAKRPPAPPGGGPPSP